MQKNNFYITTTLPYVNAKPHMGHALEFIQADAIARHKRNQGFEVFFNTGTDEHGLKIYRKALENNQDPQDYCDEYSAKFDEMKKRFNLSYDNFIRTTDPHHIKAAQEFWRRCEVNGDIYKKNYQVKYCVGCELEKTESELIDGHCPEHPNQELENINEENYFFRYSAYQQKLLDFYNNNPDFIVPDYRQTEIIKFTERGLEDFSISRLRDKMPWGVPVPGDEGHVMYVWFDALVNYISCLGWPEDEKKMKNFWPGVQIAGKDNLRQQASMWQAMLMSAGVPNSKQVLIHGFIISEGQKMSKTIGNVIDPFEYVDRYGTDAVRYYMLAEISPFEDSDMTQEKFEQKYTADLVNGLGNLVSRLTNLIAKNDIDIDTLGYEDEKLVSQIDEHMNEYKFNHALEDIWQRLGEIDETISRTEPWKIKDTKKVKQILEPLVQKMFFLIQLLDPFLPETSQKILDIFSEEKIQKSDILFPRLK